MMRARQQWVVDGLRASGYDARLGRHLQAGRLLNMSPYDEYRIVINEAQRRLIMRALTNGVPNDRRSTAGGALEWMQLIRLFSTIKPSVRK